MASLNGNALGGVSVKVVPSPVTVAAIGPLEALLIANHEPAKLTGSLNTIEIGNVASTLVAPEAGVVPCTTGGTGGGKMALIVSLRSSRRQFAVLACALPAPL